MVGLASGEAQMCCVDLSDARARQCRSRRGFRLLEGGAWRSRPGWSLLRRKPMPGLGARWLSLCDTPDLDIIPQRFPAVRTVRFFGGLEITFLHLGLSACC